MENLEDETAYYRLSLKLEVPISVIIESTHGEEEEISGRIDWALNYDAPRNIKLGSILVVWEAKRIGQAQTGLPLSGQAIYVP